MREADWKYLKIADNTFLFNVADDPMERANLKVRHKETYHRLAAEWITWNNTMLPESDDTFTHGFSGAELADHIRTPEPTRSAEHPKSTSSAED